jgi:signal transduction histidine kinase
MNLNDCIKDVLQLIYADALRNDVYVQAEFPDIPSIMIDKGEIRQLILNLVRNAIDAMPEGGTLTIETFADENGVNLVVRDEGEGIPAEIVEEIWDPFATTKETGTGLGIPVCRSIAERHNATITFDTSPEGTSFKVTFPVGAVHETELTGWDVKR